MMLGSLAGGFANGLGGGMDIATQIAALQANQRMRQAHAAVGRTMMSPNGFGGPQPPMPGEASMPANGNASPAPAMGPAPTPALPTNGAPPVPQAPPPIQPPAAGPGAGGDLGAPTQPDVVKDAQSTITSIAKAIKEANPDIAPEQLFDATSAHIEQMKGVRNDVKDYMQMQIEMAKVQARIQASENRLTGQEYTADKGYQGRTEAADIRGNAQRDVAKTQGDARVKSAGISGSSRVQAAGIGADARVKSAGIGADSRKDVAETRAGASNYAADQGYRRGVDSATALSGGTARTPAPAPRAARSTSAPAATPTRYKSADEVKADFHAGKLSKQKAVAILKSQFGMR